MGLADGGIAFPSRDRAAPHAAAHRWYAILLSNLGRHAEAVAEGERALALDPLSTVIGGDIAGVLCAADSVQRALTVLDDVLARDTVPPPVVELERALIPL